MNESAASEQSAGRLPQRALLFLAAVGVAAFAIGVAAIVYGGGEARGWPAFLLLVSAASITQLFAFHTIRNQVFHTTPLFFAAGAVLLAPQFALLLPLISHLGDWAKQRYAWYIQTFNIVNFTLAVMAAWWASRLVTENLLAGSAMSWSVGGALAAVVYVVLNNAGFAVVLKLARGHDPREILTPQVLAADLALASLGITFASFWREDPWLLPFAIAPVFLLHQALHLPELEQEARHDAKTDLLNPRYFAEGLEEELARARRFGREVSVLVADVDLLRNVNDTYGHLAGDAVLRGIAGVIRRHVSDYDVAARLGGEELAIMLAETSHEEALALAEQIREAVETSTFWAESAGEHVSATLSIGVATFPEHATEATELVHVADVAAYRAKVGGRNRVVAAAKDRALMPAGRVSAKAAMQEARRPQPGSAPAVTPPAAPARLRPGVAVIGGLGIAAGAAGAIFGGNGDVAGLVALVGFVAFTQLVAIRLDAYGSVSVAAIGVIAGAALFGVRSALLLAVTAAAVDWAVRRLPLAEIVLDVGSVSLGALAAAGVFALAPPGEVGDLATIAVGATAGAAYFAVVLAVFGVAAAAEGREPWWTRFWGRFAWLVPYYGAYGFVAAVMALAYHRADAYALAAFAVPLLAVRGTQSIFVRQAESNAESLRHASEWIQAQATSLERVNRVLRQRTGAAMESLSAMVDARDLFARGHSRRVSDLAQRMGRELGLSFADVDLLGQAALLHDIGKLAISDAILLKSGPLDPEEWLLMRGHAEKGARTIERLGFSDDAADAVRHHHEHLDGSGYPLGLRGEEIPLFARVIHAAEAYDAMCTTRFVWQRRTAADALTELRRLAGTQFDPRCVSALERVLATAPPWAVADPS